MAKKKTAKKTIVRGGKSAKKTEAKSNQRKKVSAKPPRTTSATHAKKSTLEAAGSEENRIYPEIDLDHERAVRLVAVGTPVKEVAALFCRDVSVVYKWLKIPAVEACLDAEKEKIFDCIRAEHMGIIRKCYTAIDRIITNTDDPRVLNGVIGYLDKTGFLLKSTEKVAEDKRREQMVSSATSELFDLLKKAAGQTVDGAPEAEGGGGSAP